MTSTFYPLPVFVIFTCILWKSFSSYSNFQVKWGVYTPRIFSNNLQLLHRFSQSCRIQKPQRSWRWCSQRWLMQIHRKLGSLLQWGLSSHWADFIISVESACSWHSYMWCLRCDCVTKSYGFFAEIHLEKKCEPVALVFVKEYFKNMTQTHPALKSK